MDVESSHSNEDLNDIQEFIEEHLISHQEEVIEHPPMLIPLSPTIIPLSPTFFLDSQNDTIPGHSISLELPCDLIVPEDFLNNFSVITEKPEKAEYIEDSELLEQYFKTSFSDLASDSELSKKVPENSERNDVAGTSEEGQVIHAYTPLEHPNRPQKSAKRPLKKRPTRRTLLVESESSEDDTSFSRDPKSKRPRKFSERFHASLQARGTPTVSKVSQRLKPTIPSTSTTARYHSAELLKHVHMTIEQIIYRHPAIRALVSDPEVAQNIQTLITLLKTLGFLKQ
ncbi:uncharacterized protein LOC117407014 isoform X2 [Acipenser ruthenus]|uniref:uncharacterized protein LOC117394650 n=1 Tax=Acipenser ruthenus TaxID=7906 RepID=UPI002741FF94|nr:uncharacterized protein LOC117394650 [Acipenser ruthenus]XP_058862431.1 uncharacterized protein LOC131703396 [Acipenser ruthenus]XP_058878934.1 uncharacterized protein LOC117974067 [Acipenser ruthenus]XP_058890848.1 uncharacterized protein LOC131740096 [Acipenser ruthenus]XP_058890907.1 uncharacterized protein LOC117407014 isoform X2 [Acipenser ruthenus]